MSITNLISQTTTTPRNDYTGFVGYTVTVVATVVYITHLARWIIAGNTQTHTVKLVDAATGLDILGGSVSVDTTLFASGGWAFVPLAVPVVRVSGQTHYTVSSETNGGDQFYDTGNISDGAAGDFTSYSSIYYLIGWNLLNGNQSFVPVNFKYQYTAPAPSSLPPSVYPLLLLGAA